MAAPGWMEVAPPVMELRELLPLHSRLYRTPSVGSGRARRAVWPLTTLLTEVFAWKVAAVMPSAIAAVVWGLAVATTFGGFFALFVPG